MRMTGEQRIAAPRERVWAALNDPEVLRQCIPGCQSLEKEADDRLRAIVEIKIGPIGAKFAGLVILSELDPPQSYLISGQGQGGTVGSAKGAARVRLAAADDETVLTYEVDAEVGGRLAQLGGPIIDATAQQLAGRFFKQFREVVEGTGTAAAAAPAPAPASTWTPRGAATPVPQPAAHIPSSPATGGTPWAWITAVVLALLAGFYLGVSQAGLGWLLIVIILLVVAAAAGYEAGRRGGGGA